MEFLVLSFKNSCFFIRTPSCFFRYFHFTTEFYYWRLHLFISPILGFFITLSSGVSVSPLFVTTIFWVFSFSYSQAFFYLTLLPHICHSTASATNFREAFCSQVFFALHSFPTFSTTCIYQAGFPTEVWNTDSNHMFNWIPQCSAKCLSRQVLLMC